MRRVLAAVRFAFITISLTTVSVHADEITVTSGEATSINASDPIRMTLGFDDTTLSLRWNNSFVLQRLVCSAECAPGDLVSLNMTAFHTGPILTEGLPNDTVGSFGPGPGFFAVAGSMSFVTPGVIVPSSSDDTSLTAPFTMSGTIQGIDASGREPVPLFTDNVAGQGVATAQLLRDPNTGKFDVTVIHWNFSEGAPTPEPGTLVLLAVGTATSVVLLRRRRITS